MLITDDLECAGARHEASAIDPDQDRREAGGEENILRHPEIQIQAVLGQYYHNQPIRSCSTHTSDIGVLGFHISSPEKPGNSL